MSECIFCKIVRGEIPSEIVYQDDVCLAFRDINPGAPTHVLIIPREHIATLNDLTPEHESTVGHILLVAREIAGQQGVAASGYRVVANCNSDGGQAVFHIHFHLLGGRQLSWPPG
ncbi:histidine triad nucleotide-binding protein [Myxococcota bacterium]